MAQEYHTIRSLIRGDALILRILDRRLVEPDHIARLGDELETVVRGSAKRMIVLDFSAVEFLSSAMLTVLISLSAMAHDQKQSLGVAALSDELGKMFKMIKLDRRIRIFKDCDDAIAGL